MAGARPLVGLGDPRRSRPKVVTVAGGGIMHPRSGVLSDAGSPGLAGTTRHLHVPADYGPPRGDERVSALEAIGSAGTFVRSASTIRDAAMDLTGVAFPAIAPTATRRRVTEGETT